MERGGQLHPDGPARPSRDPRLAFLEPNRSAYVARATACAHRRPADESANTYGAVYLWRDDEALAAFVSSELWAGVRALAALANISENSFDCIEAFTRETQPVLSIVYEGSPHRIFVIP